MAWQQANANAIVLNRSDSPFLDNIFVFAANAAIQLSSTTYGVTTALAAGNISCDSTKYCLDVQATGTSGQIANMRQYGQAGVAGNVPYPGSAAINFGANGQGIFQISNLSALAIDAAVVTGSNSNSSGCSSIGVGNLYANFAISSQPAVSYLNVPSACGSGKTQMLVSTLPQSVVNVGAGQTISSSSGSGAQVYLNGVVSSGLNQFASTTSAQLASVIPDATGTGALVFGNSPTLTSPLITNASSPISVNGGSGSAVFAASGAPGFNRIFRVQSNGSDRWWIGGDATAETGSNAGTAFQVQRFSDSGASLGTPFSISRQSGLASFANGISVTGNVVATGTGTMPLYSAAGTSSIAPHMVTGSATLSSGSATVTLSGAAVYSSSTSYTCTANDTTAANSVKVSQSSGTSIAFTGTGSDTVQYICAGN
nr:hypothetical protein [Burkholderia multivorans]